VPALTFIYFIHRSLISASKVLYTDKDTLQNWLGQPEKCYFQINIVGSFPGPPNCLTAPKYLAAAIKTFHPISQNINIDKLSMTVINPLAGQLSNS